MSLEILSSVLWVSEKNQTTLCQNDGNHGLPFQFVQLPFKRLHRSRAVGKAVCTDDRCSNPLHVTGELLPFGLLFAKALGGEFSTNEKLKRRREVGRDLDCVNNGYYAIEKRGHMCRGNCRLVSCVSSVVLRVMGRHKECSMWRM